MTLSLWQRFLAFSLIALTLAIFAFVTITAATLIHETFRASISSASWPTAPGRFVALEVRRGCGRGGTGYYLEARYQYVVADKPYLGDKVSFGSSYCGDKSSTQWLADDLSNTQPRSVYYNPTNPRDAVLIRSTNDGSKTALFIGLFSLFLHGFYWAWKFIDRFRGAARPLK